MAAVFDACSLSEWGRAEKLFDEDPQAAVVFRDRQQWSLLHEAANRNAPVAFVKKLIMYGLNPNDQNATQRTPLHYAMQQQSSPDLIKLLLDVGANPCIKDKLGKTPLHWGVLETMPIQALKTVIDAGGDMDIPDNDGKTVVHTAVDQKVSSEYMQGLISLGVDINRPDKDGLPLLYTAVFVNAPPSLIAVLLRNGATIDSARFRVARYHGDAQLCAQIEKALVMVTLCCGTIAKRGSRRNTSYLRAFPRDLLRTLAATLFPEFGDHLIVRHENEDDE